MDIEIITERAELLIRRLTLAPGESTHWHSDTCHRFSVLVRGERLAIEYADDGAPEELDVHAGMAGWDEPQPRTHRAVNTGSTPFEEIVTFYRTGADVEPQPASEGPP